MNKTSKIALWILAFGLAIALWLLLTHACIIIPADLCGAFTQGG